MSLHKEEKEILKQIRDSDYSTLQHGKDDNGIPFLQHIFKLHYQLFGQTCSNCPGKITGYIQKLKNYNFNTMKKPKTAKAKSKAQYQIAEGTLLIFAGTNRSYSTHNLTDEVAIEYLAQNPNRRSLFTKTPDNLEKVIDAYHKEVEATEKAKADAIQKEKEEKESAEKLEQLKKENFDKRSEKILAAGFDRNVGFFVRGNSKFAVDKIYDADDKEFDALLESTKEEPVKPELKAPENIEVKSEKVTAKTETEEPVKPELKAKK